MLHINMSTLSNSPFNKMRQRTQTGTKKVQNTNDKQVAKDRADDLIVAARFETPLAVGVGLLLLYGAGFGLFILMVSDPNISFLQALPSCLWTVVLGIQMGVVLSPGTISPTTARYLTYGTSILLLGLPHLPVCSRGTGRATGAAQGAASLLTVTRSFQILHNIEHGDPVWIKSWGRWRRFYQGCGLSWHDVDVGHVRLSDKVHTFMLLKRLTFMSLGLAVPCTCIAMLSPPSSMFSGLMALRCLFMCAAMVFAFNVFDLAYRFLISSTLGLDVNSIMSATFWKSETVSEIWLGWNLPVQRLLGGGVYKPLRKCGVSGNIARLVVFLISGLGHIYPCMVAGLNSTQILLMMSFFAFQVVLVSVEKIFGLRSRIWSIGIEICLSPLFVMPVLYFTDPALIGVE